MDQAQERGTCVPSSKETGPDLSRKGAEKLGPRFPASGGCSYKRPPGGGAMRVSALALLCGLPSASAF